MSAPVHRPSPPPWRAVAVWLLLVCAAIAVMVVLGGVTRLAHAGLSIVEWRPVTGVLPPLSDAQWEEVFALPTAAHLGLALSIYAYGLWLALGLLGVGGAIRRSRRPACRVT